MPGTAFSREGDSFYILRAMPLDFRMCDDYNALGVDDDDRKQAILRELFPYYDFGLFRAMDKPIFIDNMKEITIGKNFYSNIHFSFIGGCTVEIGDNVFVGPYCTLATGIHSLIAEGF